MASLASTLRSSSVRPMLQCSTPEDLSPQACRLIRMDSDRFTRAQTTEYSHGWSWCYAMCKDTPSVEYLRHVRESRR